MNRKNRLIGMAICLIVIAISPLVVFVFGKLPEFYLYLILFVTGYAFRESIEKELEQE